MGSVLQVEIDPDVRIGNRRADLGVSTVTNKGVKVESNKDIVLYGINKKHFSTDSFLALPIAAVGESYLPCYASFNFVTRFSSYWLGKERKLKRSITQFLSCIIALFSYTGITLVLHWYYSGITLVLLWYYTGCTSFCNVS